MRRLISNMFAIFLLVLVVGLAGNAGWAGEVGRMTVTGQGQVDAVPDMATISVGVTSEARTARAALGANSTATAKVLAGIVNAGIAERDVQTSGLSLSPRWSERTSQNSPAQIIGYVVHNQVQVRVRDLSVVGVLLDLLVGNGANQFSGLRFGLQDNAGALEQARAGAVADALAKARVYAAAAGVTLGPIVSITEAGAPQERPVGLREMAMDAAVPIAAGEISVQAGVTVVFEITP